jgi:glycosyltransferase involved in cell wall biosynthesis
LANWVATVPHGLAEERYRFTAKPKSNYLAFPGRISPEKRPDRAFAIAKRAGLKLKIAAKVDAVDRTYFADMIEPLLSDPLIEFIGVIDDSQKSEFLGEAKALLTPLRQRPSERHRAPITADTCREASLRTMPILDIFASSIT